MILSELKLGMRLRIMRFHADMRIYAVAVYPICAYVFNMRMIRILIYAVYAHVFSTTGYVCAYANKSKHLYFKRLIVQTASAHLFDHNQPHSG